MGLNQRAEGCKNIMKLFVEHGATRDRDVMFDFGKKLDSEVVDFMRAQ